MPKDSLSERDRLRLAKLMREPLLTPRLPAQFPQKRNQWRSWVEQKLKRVRHELSAWRNARSAEPVRRHYAAHWRAWYGGDAAMEVCLLVPGREVMLESQRG